MEEQRVSCFQSCCRLCLCESADSLRSIFDESLEDRDLPQKISECLAVEICVNDKLSKMVCEQCLSMVKNWHLFKDQCELNQSKLQEWLANNYQNEHQNGLDNATLQIKEEPIDEATDESIEENEEPDSRNDDIVTVKRELVESNDVSMEEDYNELPPSLSPQEAKAEDDFEKAVKKCREAEDTSNLESDDVYAIRKRKVRAKRNYSSSEDSEEDNEPSKKIKEHSERPPRFNHIFSKTIQESSCPLISTPLTSPTSRTSTPTSNIYNTNSYALGKSVQDITPVRTTPVRAISTVSTKNQGLDHNNILSLLYQIREQNDQILNHLNKKHQEVGAIPNDLPVEWPIETIEQLNELEAYLTSRDNLSGMVSYLSSLGGKDFTSRTNIILRHLITDELATFFSFRGKRQKRPFCELSLSECIIRAVKKTENATNVQVENVVKVWLKHAPQRWTKKNNTQ